MMSSTANGSEQAARMLDEVEAELSRAVAELQALKAERDVADAAVRAAEAAQESWRLEELERRGRNLRAQIEAGHARLWRLYTERARLQLPEAEARAEAARAEYEAAHAEYLEAFARTNRLGVEANNAGVRVLSLRQTMEENERKAQALAGKLSARQA
jgi:DNA repair exonuclease SbcCD ATPase subunit